jgi:hypothetical protein
MAISFDSSGSGSGSSGNGSASITIASDATFAVVTISAQTSVTGVTLGGQSMTQFDTARNVTTSWYLKNPPTGSQTVTATKGGGLWSLCVATWKDINQTSTPNSTGGGEGNSTLTVSTTTTVDNTRLIFGVGTNNNQGISSSTSGAVKRVEVIGTVATAIFDVLTAQTPAGSKSVNASALSSYMAINLMSVVQGAVATINNAPLAFFID